MNFDEVVKTHQDDINQVQKWADEQYDTYFGPHFKEQAELYKRIHSKSYVITDQDLEWILTTLPLELIAVSEEVSKMKTAQEVIKLHIKEVENEIINNPEMGDTRTKRQEAAAQITAGDRLLSSVYTIIAERVDKQVSFSRELIMSAKKLWDARKESNMLLPTPGSLGEYDFNK